MVCHSLLCGNSPASPVHLGWSCEAWLIVHWVTQDCDPGDHFALFSVILVFILEVTGLQFLFFLFALCWMRIRGLCKLPSGRDWLWGKLGLALVGRAMLSKFLVQFSADGGSCACTPPPTPSPVRCLAWDSSVLESIGSMIGLMATSFKSTYANMLHLPRLLLLVLLIQWKLLSIHSSARDSQTLIGKTGTLFCGVTVPFPWVLVLTNVCLCPPKSVSPVVWKFCYQILLTLKVRFPGSSLSPCQIPRFRSLNWVLDPSQQCENFFGRIVVQFVGHNPGGCMIGLMATSSKWTYDTCPTSMTIAGSALIPAPDHCWPTSWQQTLTGRSGSVSCGGYCSFSCILISTIVCLCPPRISGRYGVWF